MHAAWGLSHPSAFYLQICHEWSWGTFLSCKYCCDPKKHGGWAGHRAKMVAHLTSPGKGGKCFHDQRAGAGCLEEEDIRLLLENLTTTKEAAPVWFEKEKYDAILTLVSDRHNSMKDHRLKLAESGTASFLGGSVYPDFFGTPYDDGSPHYKATREEEGKQEAELEEAEEAIWSSFSVGVGMYEELAVGDIHVFPMETSTLYEIQS